MTAEELLLEISKYGGVIEYDYTPLQIGRVFKKGDAPTDQTWEKITEWCFGWRRVVVVGACCGYITSKLFDIGAKEVFAVEHTQEKCEVIRMVLGYNHPDANFRVCCYEWEDFPVPECDLIIALNVTHHFEDNKEAQIKKIVTSAPHAIIEAPLGDIEIVKKYSTPTIIPSPGRISRRIAIT